MPPKDVDVYNYPVEDDGSKVITPVVTEETHEQKRPPLVYVWSNIAWMTGLHLACLVGIFLFPQASYATWIWSK